MGKTVWMISVVFVLFLGVVTFAFAQAGGQPNKPSIPANATITQVSSGQEASSPNIDDRKDRSNDTDTDEVLVSEEEVVAANATNPTAAPVSKVRTVSPIKIASPSGKQVSKDLVVSGPVFDIEQK